LTKPDLQLRLLLSYWYFRDDDMAALLAQHFNEPYPEVFADSGAFSAFSEGTRIDVAEYGDWLNKNKGSLFAYANLDVKGATKSTIDEGLRNQAYLESQGLNPLPVFHGGEPPSVLEDFIKDYPYIALGGIAGEPLSTDLTMRFLIDCFVRAGKRTVFHGFGIASWPLLLAFPFYSVDTSSWGSGFRWGKVPIFCREKGKILRLKVGHPMGWARHSYTVTSLGFDPRDYATEAVPNRAKVCQLAGVSYMMSEHWLRNRHGTVEVPRRKDAFAQRGWSRNHWSPGLKMFLADSSKTNLKDTAWAYQGIEIYRRRGR